jgi:hypothetical protein
MTFTRSIESSVDRQPLLGLKNRRLPSVASGKPQGGDGSVFNRAGSTLTEACFGLENGVHPIPLSDRGCDDTHRMMAYRSDRRGGKPATSVALRGHTSRLAPRAWIFHHGQERPRSITGRRYVCSLTPTPRTNRSFATLSLENDPVARPRTRSPKGGGYLTPPGKASLAAPRRSIHERGLDLTAFRTEGGIQERRSCFRGGVQIRS